MKYIGLVLLLLFSYQSLAAEVGSSPLEVVNARMLAYNNHDLEAFLNTYSDKIQVYTYPDIKLGKAGKAHITYIFEPMFKDKSVSVVIHSQITQGNYVINHETVTYDGKGKKYVSIYEVVKGKILSVRFLRE